MGITIFSFMMAVIWFNTFIAVISLMQRRSNFITNFSIMPLLLLMVICFSRLLWSFELPITVVIHSVWLFPAIIDFFTVSRFSVWNSGIGVSLLDVLTVFWVLGSIYFLQMYILQSIKLHRAIHTSEETQDSQILFCLNEIMTKIKKNIKVRFIQVSWVTVPMVMGFFKPTIFLPDISFTDVELKSILLHELTHFLYKDAWIKLYMYLISAIFWWNPFVHVLKTSLNHILEIRCDLKLTAKMNEDDRLQYLESIVKIVKYKLGLNKVSQYTGLPPASLLISTNNIKKIEQRFTLVLDNVPKKRYKPIVILVYAAILLSFLCSYMFVLQPVYQPTVQDGYEETFSVSPQNAYLKNNKDGTHALYVDNQYQFDITNICEEPFSSLPIKQ